MPRYPRRLGKTYRFDYPKEFVTLPEYTAHRGVTVTVIRQLTRAECDLDNWPMWEVQAADGWKGHAYDDELTSLGICHVAASLIR